MYNVLYMYDVQLRCIRHDGHINRYDGGTFCSVFKQKAIYTITIYSILLLPLLKWHMPELFWLVCVCTGDG